MVILDVIIVDDFLGPSNNMSTGKVAADHVSISSSWHTAHLVVYEERVHSCDLTSIS